MAKKYEQHFNTIQFIVIIVIIVMISGLIAATNRQQRIYVNDKLTEIIRQQDELKSILYAPPVYEKKILFYEAADPYGDHSVLKKGPDGHLQPKDSGGIND